MNAIATIDSVVIDAQEEALTEQAGTTVRVALREIRENAYRALVVAGATPGEAAAAAEQVVHAEVHHGDGVEAFARELARGVWPRGGLECERQPGPRPRLVVTGGERSGALRLGAALIDLVAGEEGGAVVTTASEIDVTSLLDASLVGASAAASTSILVLRRSPDGLAADVRWAAPDGTFAHGHIEPAGATALTEHHGLQHLDGLILLTDVAVDAPEFGALSRSDADQRVEQRRRAARRGLDVDARAWHVIVAQARHFLVPEREA